MNLSQFIAILKARILLILITLIIAVGTAAYFTYMEPKRYVASTSLLLNFTDDSPFASTPIPAQLSSSYISTQIDIIRSQKVALKAVEILGLAEDPRVRQAHKSSGSKLPLEEWQAAALTANVSAEPLRNSRVIQISYRAYQPDQAARMANAFAKAFIATTLELNVEPSRRNAEWFDEQLQVLRKRLELARARMTEFQVEQGIVALDDRLSAENTRLQDISKNLVEAQAATYAARARQLGINHPEYQSAVQRERSLAASLAQQKRSILTLKEQRDELEARTREVESEQKNYDATLQGYFRSLMESQFNQTNIAILGEALPPQSPASPNVALNMISAAALGLILGLLLAVLAELLNPRVLPAEQ